MLSRIGNRIVADNQRAVFTKLLNEGLGFSPIAIRPNLLPPVDRRRGATRSSTC
jgi:hypothetical protein